MNITKEEYDELKSKAEKYDKLVSLMDELYAEESTADLADIGEQLACQMGYL